MAALCDRTYLSWTAASADVGSQDLSQLVTPTILINGRNVADLGVQWWKDGALQAAIEAAKG